MKYYKSKLKLKKEEKLELEGKLTSLDRAILDKADKGSDIIEVLGACKPYKNKWGSKEFANSDNVLKAVNKLLKLGLLERR